MPKPLNPTRPLLALAALAAIALGASGCGTSTANVDRGRVLFVQNCGTCHAMAQAGTTAQIGPNLDDAFSAARAVGEDGDTIEGVVKAQVENPRPSNANPAVSMPAGLVSGQDLEDVAAYVARYAGVPGAAPPKAPGGLGAQVFANNGCGGCHALAAANSGGAIGPNLDEVSRGPEPRRWSTRRSSTRTKSSPRDYPRQRDAAELQRHHHPGRAQPAGSIPGRFDRRQEKRQVGAWRSRRSATRR